MKLKTVTIEGKTYAVVDDSGRPVYVSDDGKEVGYDAPAAAQKIRELNAEAKGHREAKEDAQAKLKAYEGIEDPAQARKALETVKNLDEKKLVDAGKVEEVKAAAIKAVRDEFAPVVKERDTLKMQLDNEIIGGNFARSKFIAEKLAVPVDMIQATFGKQFEVKDGKLVAKGVDGNPIYSRDPNKAGEPAMFDEALEIIVNGYAAKDSILKSNGGTGGGSQQRQQQGGTGGGRTMTRAQFDTLSPFEKHTTAVDPNIKIVD